MVIFHNLRDLCAKWTYMFSVFLAENQRYEVFHRNSGLNRTITEGAGGKTHARPTLLGAARIHFVAKLGPK